MGSPTAWIPAGMQLRLRPDWPSDGPAHQADGGVVQEVASCVLVAAAAELACFLRRVVSILYSQTSWRLLERAALLGATFFFLGAFYFSL